MRKNTTGKANSGKYSGRRTIFVRAAAIIIALCMIAALALPALAAEKQASFIANVSPVPGAAASGGGSDSQDAPYTYTVRVFPGDKGVINGSTEPFVKQIKGGQ